MKTAILSALLVLVAVCASGQVKHKLPATDTNNVWTGNNDFRGTVTCNGVPCAGGAPAEVNGQDISPKSVNGTHYVTCGGTDDSAAINAAIAAVPDKGTVVLTPLTCAIVSSEILINHPVHLSGYGATLLKKADVIGIHVTSPGAFSVLEGFKLDASYSGGSADGIVIGDADGSNGAGAVAMRDLRIWHQHGHGINARNGNSGDINNVETWANLGDGVRISSQAVGFDNTNAWRINGLKSISNNGIGLYLGDAISNVVNGMDAEGNTGHGLRIDRPYNFVVGYVEANTAGPLYVGESAFNNSIFLRSVGTVQSTLYNHANWVYFASEVSGWVPPSLMDGGQMYMHAAFGESNCATVIDDGNVATPIASSCNTTEIAPAGSGVFVITNPIGLAIDGQHLRIRIKNATTGALGAVTWGDGYKMAPWVQPSPGYGRAIDFVRISALWVEVSRSGDIPNTTETPVVDRQGGSVTTGSIAGSSSAAVTLTWPQPFVDTSYFPACSVVDPTASGATLRVHHIESFTATQVVARVVNDDSGAHTGILSCVGSR